MRSTTSQMNRGAVYMGEVKDGRQQVRGGRQKANKCVNYLSKPTTKGPINVAKKSVRNYHKSRRTGAGDKKTQNRWGEKSEKTRASVRANFLRPAEARTSSVA